MIFTDEAIERWGNYFRFFYFYEDMTFAQFLDLVAKGRTPQRRNVDWSKVEPCYKQLEVNDEKLHGVIA